MKPPFLYRSKTFQVEWEVYEVDAISCVLVPVVDYNTEYTIHMNVSSNCYLEDKIDEFVEESPRPYTMVHALISAANFYPSQVSAILTAKPRCSCEIVSLMQGGCKCGGI